MTWAEVLGAVSGLACVALVARQHVWNWPIGLANNVFWALLFWRAKLYSDSTLQGVFFALGCYGWWRWARGARGARRWWCGGRGPRVGDAGGAVAPRRAGWRRGWPRDRLAGAAGRRQRADLSLAATWGQAEKLLESWWIWIAVDVVSVPLYVSRGLYLTAAVYVVFGVLCVVGLRRWAARSVRRARGSMSTRPRPGDRQVLSAARGASSPGARGGGGGDAGDGGGDGGDGREPRARRSGGVAARGPRGRRQRDGGGDRRRSSGRLHAATRSGAPTSS
jgi:nicotinamide mononucleotide transporter